MPNRQRVCVLLALALTVSMAAPAGVAAGDDGDGYFDGLLGDDEESLGWGERASLAVTSATSWMAKTVSLVYDSDAANATVYADEFAAEFNAYNDTLVSYANGQLSPTSDYEVYRLHFTDRDETNVTRYVVADEYNGVYETARVVDAETFDEMDRSVDHWIVLDWYQSRHAASELDAFVEEYARPGENVTQTYRASTLAEYGAPESSLWPANESGSGA